MCVYVHVCVHRSPSLVESLTSSQLEKLPTRAIASFQADVRKFSQEVTADGATHLLFISHCKLDAGTETYLMRAELQQLLADDRSLPGATRRSGSGGTVPADCLGRAGLQLPEPGATRTRYQVRESESRGSTALEVRGAGSYCHSACVCWQFVSRNAVLASLALFARRSTDIHHAVCMRRRIHRHARVHHEHTRVRMKCVHHEHTQVHMDGSQHTHVRHGYVCSTSAHRQISTSAHSRTSA